MLMSRAEGGGWGGVVDVRGLGGGGGSGSGG
jgi:hypothetical protein